MVGWPSEIEGKCEKQMDEGSKTVGIGCIFYLHEEIAKKIIAMERGDC